MARKYSKTASSDVRRAMKKRKAGTLKSGRSGRKVTSRKQAIAIGLSEARAKGKTSQAIRHLVGLQPKVAFVERDGDFVEIVSGLQVGQRIVGSGAAFLQSGESVRVLQTPAPTAEQSASQQAPAEGIRGREH